MMSDYSDYISRLLGLAKGESPFPWQIRLFKRFLAGHEAPCLSLDLPTGLGKTSVMALWLGAWLHPKSTGYLPRRLVYVVDRRAVVDQSTTVAENLRQWAEKEHGVTLPISTLRGQFVDNREWLEDPTAPGIIVGTVDMVGSRLLFQGYGVSRRMRPYAAAFLGVDTLFVLDESHLAPSFERLLETLAVENTWRNGEREKSIVPGFHLLSLSATGKGRDEVLQLDKTDLEHPEVQKRVSAPKRLYLSSVGAWKELPNALARKALDLFERKSGKVLIYCNSRRMALQIKKILEKETKKREIGIGLFTGSRRVRERELAFRQLEELGFLADRGKNAPNSILVATSAAEVGVDLDADHMVCDLVNWERMVQRLGRVNRRGTTKAEVHVVFDEESEGTTRCLAPLKALPVIDGSPDAGPASIMSLRDDSDLNEILAQATTPDPPYPRLKRAEIDSWSQTSLKEHSGRPNVEPWLRGWVEEDEPQTSIIWRVYLPTRNGGSAPSEEVQDFFEAAPPHLSEKLETRTADVVDWLISRARKLSKDDSQRNFDTFAYLLDASGEPCTPNSLSLSGIEALNKKRLQAILDGALLVVDKRFGGLDADGYLNTSADGSEILTADFDSGGESVWVPNPIFKVVPGEESPKSLGDRWVRCLEFAKIIKNDQIIEKLVVYKFKDSAPFEDARSATCGWQTLEDHQELAGKKAEAMAKELNLPIDYQKMLCVAALHHDEGKRADNWQSAFGNVRTASSDPVYAKTPGPINFKLLNGYRHELGSYMWDFFNSPFHALPAELGVLGSHMIAAHHGFARPFIRVDGCEYRPSLLREHAQQIALNFFELQERWGPWGLAWWEALLRAADQQASADLKEGGENGN